MNQNLVYDVGFHNGDDTAFYLHRGFQVVAVEANPLLAAAGQQRFSDAIDRGQLNLLNVGIAAQTGAADFWVHEGHSEWSSFIKDFGCRGGGPCYAVSVQCLPLRDIFEQYGVPFYLKIDIEGHDEFCVADLDPENAPNYVSVEFGPIENIDRLAAAGYDSFKIVNQKNHNDPATQSYDFDRFHKRIGRGIQKLLRGRRKMGRQPNGSWRFPAGSSGPFGEETIGLLKNNAWLSKEEARSIMQRNNSGECPLPRGWFDLHARRREPKTLKRVA